MTSRAIGIVGAGVEVGLMGAGIAGQFPGAGPWAVAAKSGTLEKAVGPALGGDYAGTRFTISNTSKDLRYVQDILKKTLPASTPLAALMAKRLGVLVAQGRGADFVSTMFDPEKT